MCLLTAVAALSGQGNASSRITAHPEATRRETADAIVVLASWALGATVSSGPPTFVIFGGGAPDAGYRRFLENRLRAAFDLGGVPIRLRFRTKRRKRGGR